MCIHHEIAARLTIDKHFCKQVPVFLIEINEVGIILFQPGFNYFDRLLNR